MSIMTDNKAMAIQAYEAFTNASWEKNGSADDKKIAVKNYLNAVQQALLKLETQGLRRCILYITSQMGKEPDAYSLRIYQSLSRNVDEHSQMGKEPDAYSLLYEQLSEIAEEKKEAFQYKVLANFDAPKIALLSARVSFFLLCLKRLASAYEHQS